MGLKCEAGRIINTNLVKYDVLSNLISTAYAKCNKDTILIYIDVYSIIKSLFNDSVVIDDYSILSSCIINMCAHYRQFFKNINVRTYFFIVYSDNCPQANSLICSEYNSGVSYMFKSNEKMYDAITKDLGLLQVLCPYLPDIAFIKRDMESSVCIYDIMCKYDIKNEFAHMVISKDDYVIPLVDMKPDTIILRPKKQNQQDLSYYIDASNAMTIFLQNKKVKQTDTFISPGLLSVIYTCNGLKCRSLKSLYNITNTLSILSKAISLGGIVNNHSSSLAALTFFSNKTPITILQNRFAVIDIQHQHKLYMMSALNTNYSNEIINMQDPDSVKHINDKYYKNNPLDLERL